jgi:hypothetical protein
VYGTSIPTDKVKIYIKNLLAKQLNEEEDGEETLDTDEDEDYEDETDNAGTEEEDAESTEEEDDAEEEQGEQSEPPERVESEQPGNTNSSSEPDAPVGIRKCSICQKREKHYASTCPRRYEILKQHFAEKQAGGTNNMTKKGKRTCGTCDLIAGHNARRCERLRLERELQEHQKKLQNAKVADAGKKAGSKKRTRQQNETPTPTEQRRSSRLKQ